MQVVIVFDGDNTLWDTDIVFRRAQCALLQTLADAHLLTHPSDHLAYLRRIDQTLIQQLGCAEYDVTILAHALIVAYTTAFSEAEAIHSALTTLPMHRSPRLAALIEAACAAFTTALDTIPPLFPGVQALLTQLRTLPQDDARIATVLLSEGSPPRITRILAAHTLDANVFDAIILQPKSCATFQYAVQRGMMAFPRVQHQRQVVALSIGDSLQRDVRFSNQAGLLSVYKPSAYQGHETPTCPAEQPWATIPDLTALMSVLEYRGIIEPVCTDGHQA